MSAAKKIERVAVQDYLAGELISPIKHEYLGGVVYAMAGSRNAHSIIQVNIIGRMLERLRGKPCQPYGPDTKIRIHLPTHIRFYYPDTSVICRPNPQSDSFQDEPAVLFEVLSAAHAVSMKGRKRRLT